LVRCLSFRPKRRGCSQHQLTRELCAVVGCIAFGMDKASQTIMKYKSQLISSRTATNARTHNSHTIFACAFLRLTRVCGFFVCSFVGLQGRFLGALWGVRRRVDRSLHPGLSSGRAVRGVSPLPRSPSSHVTECTTHAPLRLLTRFPDPRSPADCLLVRHSRGEVLSQRRAHPQVPTPLDNKPN
jgi:hypothetical protein